MLSRKNFWIIATNSTTAFVLSYLFVFYMNQFSLVLTAGMYHYPITIDYASYFFHIEPYQWTHDAVYLIFTSPYVLIFFTGLLALFAFYHILADAFPIKIFFLWLALHAANFFFGGLLAGNVFIEGIGHVFNWMYLQDTARLIISMTGFFGLLLTALLSARLFSLSSNAYFEKYNERMMPFFITAQMIVPYFFGSVIVYLYFLPKNMFHERYGWIVLGIILLISFLKVRYSEDLLFEDDSRPTVRLMKGFFLFTVITYVGTRLIFHSGFHFYH